MCYLDGSIENINPTLSLLCYLISKESGSFICTIFVCNHFIPFMGSWGVLLEPGPSVMAEANTQGANHTGAIWGSVSCLRTL